MHVGVKETVAQRLREKLAHDQDGDALCIMTRGGELVRGAHERTLHPFRGEDARSRASPVDGRNAEIGITCGTLRQHRSRCGFHPEVEFDGDACRQRVHERAHAEAPRFGKESFGPTRCKGKGRKVARELLFHGGPIDTDGGVRHIAQAYDRFPGNQLVGRLGGVPFRADVTLLAWRALGPELDGPGRFGSRAVKKSEQVEPQKTCKTRRFHERPCSRRRVRGPETLPVAQTAEWVPPMPKNACNPNLPTFVISG